MQLYIRYSRDDFPSLLFSQFNRKHIWSTANRVTGHEYIVLMISTFDPKAVESLYQEPRKVMLCYKIAKRITWSTEDNTSCITEKPCFCNALHVTCTVKQFREHLSNVYFEAAF